MLMQRLESQTLLRLGREAEWERLNAEKRELLAGDGSDSLEVRLHRGQRLSAQAATLRRAIVGH